jgi:hypothetical protein
MAMNGVCNTWTSRWSALQKSLAKEPEQRSLVQVAFGVQIGTRAADSWLGRALDRTGCIAKQAGAPAL